MGRRPIIIPRHQSQVKGAREPILKADSLAHPLAFVEEREEKNSSFGSNNSNGIGIRRHGQHVFSTPEKKKRTRMVRKRSPTSVLLPLEFIEEEEEEDQEELLYGKDSSSSDYETNIHNSYDNFINTNTNSVISESAVLSGTREYDEERLSDIFDDSVFGSVIEHVDESNDFDLLLPEIAGFGRDSSSDGSTGTFGEMMRQQEHEMRYQQERDRMAEDHMASLLATSAGSTIGTTSTLERSLEHKRRIFFKDENKRSPFQRLLKTATQCGQSRSEIKNYNAMMERKYRNPTNVPTKKPTNIMSTTQNNMRTIVPSNYSTNPMRMNLPTNNVSTNHRGPTVPSNSPMNVSNPKDHMPTLLLPEEQRKAALARYRYNQIVHTQKSNVMNQKPKPFPLICKKEDHDRRGSSNPLSPEDSFASIDDELQCLKDFTLQSNASFRQAETCLSNDWNDSKALVKNLEDQLQAAKEQRKLCQERYELAKDKRQKEKELTAIRTLHLEILNCSGQNDRSRSMILERHKHEIASGGTGILGMMLSRKMDVPADEVNTSIQSDIFNDPHVHKSVEELRIIKNRLEAIKDLFDKARYMVSEELTSQSDRLRKQRQSQVMIETATSKYILFHSKKLV